MRVKDERGSLPLAILVAAAGLAITGLLSTALLSQVKDVRRVAERGRALGAAEAGLQVALGYIRAAADSKGNGDPAALPCGTLQGPVSEAPGNAYRVEVTYLSASGGQLSCPPTQTPATARLKSWDVTDGSAGGASFDATVSPRVLEATYRFQTPQAQTPKGLIRNYPSGSLCMDAGDRDPPTAGAEVWMRRCDAARPNRQMFAYVKSMAIAHPKPAQSSGVDMCLDAVRPATGSSVPVTFQPCAVAIDDTTTQSPARQLWTLSKNFAGFLGTDDAKTTNGWCITLESPAADETRLIYKTCPGTTYNSSTTMQPEQAVGAGAAGASTEQLVNYEQFGRCLDVTEGNVNYGALIVWPCTAEPVAANISWNQRWTLPATTGKVTVTYTSKGVSTLYCLKSPRSTATGQVVTITKCSGAATADITWTRYAEHDDNDKSYTLVDSAGFCLESSTTQLYTRLGDRIGKAVVGKCDGRDLQKWNGVRPTGAGLSDLQEK
ncbi:ricin-type beta-trefoil lectin domain protein [Actinoplanes sp. NBC_00393]|uniref:RICIN domain-containing protein n=1 Tax=Actinoplanes sp. NBC_00393 TaxID=2975953 RepID=UPI002E202BD4